MTHMHVYLPSRPDLTSTHFLPPVPADVRLEEVDKAKWLEWTKMNVMRHWDADEGPIKTSDVIVIDDPQGARGTVELGVHSGAIYTRTRIISSPPTQHQTVSGLIPWIRQRNPKAKIVYRSHIEIRADLIRDNPDGPQAQVRVCVINCGRACVYIRHDSSLPLIFQHTHTDLGLPLVGHQAGGRVRLAPRGQLRARRRAHGERGTCACDDFSIKALALRLLYSQPLPRIR